MPNVADPEDFYHAIHVTSENVTVKISYDTFENKIIRVGYYLQGDVDDMGHVRREYVFESGQNFTFAKIVYPELIKGERVYLHLSNYVLDKHTTTIIEQKRVNCDHHNVAYTSGVNYGIYLFSN